MKRAATLVPLAAVLLQLVAATARAQCPIPAAAVCLVPPFIDVVGRGPSGAPDPRGMYHVRIFDAAGAPCPNVPVVLDFCQCFDMELDALQPGVNCPVRQVTAFTNADGQANFLVLGSARNHGAAPGPGFGCVVVSAGIPLTVIRNITCTETDENGHAVPPIPGVEVTDLNAWLIDFGAGPYFGRSDFDHNGALSIPDFSVLINVLGLATSIIGPSSFCLTTCP